MNKQQFLTLELDLLELRKQKNELDIKNKTLNNKLNELIHSYNNHTETNQIVQFINLLFNLLNFILIISLANKTLIQNNFN